MAYNFFTTLMEELENNGALEAIAKYQAFLTSEDQANSSAIIDYTEHLKAAFKESSKDAQEQLIDFLTDKYKIGEIGEQEFNSFIDYFQSPSMAALNEDELFDLLKKNQIFSRMTGEQMTEFRAFLQEKRSGREVLGFLADRGIQVVIPPTYQKQPPATLEFHLAELSNFNREIQKKLTNKMPEKTWDSSKRPDSPVRELYDLCQQCFIKQTVAFHKAFIWENLPTFSRFTPQVMKEHLFDYVTKFSSQVDKLLNVSVGTMFWLLRREAPKSVAENHTAVFKTANTSLAAIRSLVNPVFPKKLEKEQKQFLYQVIKKMDAKVDKSIVSISNSINTINDSPDSCYRLVVASADGKSLAFIETGETFSSRHAAIHRANQIKEIPEIKNEGGKLYIIEMAKNQTTGNKSFQSRLFNYFANKADLADEMIRGNSWPPFLRSCHHIKDITPGTGIVSDVKKQIKINPDYQMVNAIQRVQGLKTRLESNWLLRAIDFARAKIGGSEENITQKKIDYLTDLAATLTAEYQKPLENRQNVDKIIDKWDRYNNSNISKIKEINQPRNFSIFSVSENAHTSRQLEQIKEEAKSQQSAPRAS